MKFWNLAEARQYAGELLTAAEMGEMQVIGRADQPAIILLNIDQLFEPDRSKWGTIQLDIPDELLDQFAALAKESDLPLNDLIVLVIFEFIAWRRLDALNQPAKDPEKPA